MIILPAIDIIDGNCVRLVRGDYSTAEKVAENALDTALGFRAAGSQWLHTVDLDGAKAREPINQKVIVELAQQSGLLVEVGGGIREMSTVRYYLENGVSRVILGSAAIKDPNFVKEAVAEFHERIAVGIDAKNGFVAAEGWTESLQIDYIDLAKRMEDIGVQTIIYTDISKDGTLQGPNLEELACINNAVSCNIIASGGISDISDIAALKGIDMYGAICGKSLYKGTLALSEAIKVAGE